MDEECMEDERWWIFYYLINKENEKPKCYKEQKDLLFFIKNTWFTNFKLQDPYENLNLTNHTCVLKKW